MFNFKYILFFTYFTMITMNSLSFLQIPYSEITQVIYYFSICFLIVILIIRYMIYKVIFIPNNFQLIILLSILIWKFIHFYFSFEIMDATINVMTFVLVIIIYLIATSNLLTFSSFLKINLLSIIFIFIISITLENYFEHNVTYRLYEGSWIVRESWLFSHANTAALFGLTGLILTVFLIKEKNFFLYYLLAITFIYLIYLTNSRTSLIVAILFASLFVLINKIKGFSVKKVNKMILIYFSANLLIVLIFSYLIIGFEKVNKLFSNRLEIYINIIDTMDSFFVGEGLFPPGGNSVLNKTINGFNIDSLYVNIYFNEGFIGLLLYLVLFMSLLFDNKRKSDDFAAEINDWHIKLVLFIALIYSITETHFFAVNNSFTVVVFGMVSYISLSKKVNDERIKPISKK